MLKMYAMTTDDFPKKNTPRSHEVPSRQVNTAHAFTQYLTFGKREVTWYVLTYIMLSKKL